MESSAFDKIEETAESSQLNVENPEENRQEPEILENVPSENEKQLEEQQLENFQEKSDTEDDQIRNLDSNTNEIIEVNCTEANQVPQNTTESLNYFSQLEIMQQQDQILHENRELGDEKSDNCNGIEDADQLDPDVDVESPKLSPTTAKDELEVETEFLNKPQEAEEEEHEEEEPEYLTNIWDPEPEEEQEPQYEVIAPDDGTLENSPTQTTLKIIPDDYDDEICPMVKTEGCQESNEQSQEELVELIEEKHYEELHQAEESCTEQYQYEIYENGQTYNFEISEQPTPQMLQFNSQHVKADCQLALNQITNEIINLDDSSGEQQQQDYEYHEPEINLEEEYGNNDNIVIEIDEDDEEESYQCVLCPKSYNDNSKLVSHVICKHTSVAHKKCECCAEDPITVAVPEPRRKRQRPDELAAATSTPRSKISTYESTSQYLPEYQQNSEQAIPTILNCDTIQNLIQPQFENIENFTGNQIFEIEPTEIIDLNPQEQQINFLPQTLNVVSNSILPPQTVTVIPPKTIAQQQQFQNYLQPETTTIFKCIHCSKFFTKKSDLQRHTRKNHEKNTRPYQCQYCEKLFLSESLLKQHQLTHIKEIIIV